jgi:hypothetical protein
MGCMAMRAAFPDTNSVGAVRAETRGRARWLASHAPISCPDCGVPPGAVPDVVASHLRSKLKAKQSTRPPASESVRALDLSRGNRSFAQP